MCNNTEKFNPKMFSRTLEIVVKENGRKFMERVHSRVIMGIPKLCLPVGQHQGLNTVCVCVCVCVCACMHVSVYVHICVSLRACVHVCIWVCMHACMCACM